MIYAAEHFLKVYTFGNCNQSILNPGFIKFVLLNVWNELLIDLNSTKLFGANRDIPCQRQHSKVIVFDFQNPHFANFSHIVSSLS